jgi:beta-D-xylosidase 4
VPPLLPLCRCGSSPCLLLDNQSHTLSLRWLKSHRSVCLCESSYSVEDGRNEKGDTWDISLRDLSEYYFAPLRACVEKADVGAYMCSYDAVNGTASCGNEWMLSTVVRSHWGFEGVVESDCGAVEGISSHMHGGWSSATMEVAVAAMNATVSIDCGVVGPKNAYTRNLRAAVDQKLISRAQLEMAVARVYKGRFAIGEFDVHSTLYKGLPDDTIFSAAHRQLSLETAQQSLVLLRNNNNSGAAKLPLRPGLKIAIIGPNGNSSHIFQGSYHGANCPNDGEISGAQVRDESCLPSALDEIIARNAVGGGTTTFVSGCSGPTWAEANNNKANAKNKDHMPGQTLCKNLVNISQVNATVAAADVVILAVGLALQVTSAEETDRAHSAAGYALPGKQLELCKLVRELGKPTVVLHFAGMAVGMDWLAEQYDWPLLVPGYGGRFGPVAVAAALFGEFSPTGKLPYTVYKEDWAAKTPMADMSLTAGDGRTYKWLGFENASIAPSFAFGTGTSYSTFGVSVRKISVSARAAEQSERYSGVARGALPPVASFSIATTNHGVVAASDATLVFVAPTANISTQAPRPLPKKQLVEFVRTPVLEPGATHRDVVHLHEEAFAMADWRGWSTAYSGTYQVLFDNGDGQTSAHEVTIAEHAVLDVMPAPPAVKSGGV